MALDALEGQVVLGGKDEVKRRSTFRRPTTEGPVAKAILIALALGFLALFLVLPLIAVFLEAFRRGIGEFLLALGEPDTVAAIRLTLTVAAIAVPLNVVFGITAA
jgi:sulfate transport system permease protein